MIRFLFCLLIPVSLASSPGHKIKYKSLKGKFVEEEVSSATYDVLPEGYDETAVSNPWEDMNTSMAWNEWPGSPIKPELRINSYESSSGSEENDILLTGSRISCILGSKAALSAISVGLLFGTLYWRELLCQDEKQFGMLGAWISLLVLALAEEALSIVDVSLIVSKYFNVSGAIATVLRIMCGIALFMPLTKLVGLLFMHGQDDGPVRELCNTTIVSPFVQWRWIGLEMVPAGLLFLFTLGMLRANSAIMDQNTGSIVIYDRLP